MKKLILIATLLGLSQMSWAQNDKEYFKNGIEASSLVKCGLGLAIAKIKTRDVPGDISLKGEVDMEETNRYWNYDIFDEQNKTAMISIDFEGTVGKLDVNGKIVIFAQKKQDAQGRVLKGVVCKLGTHNQLQTSRQRRFKLIDTKTRFEID